MFRFGQLTFILWLLVSLVGCNNAITNTETNVVLTEKNNGTTVNIRTGDTLEVQLKGNPTTGYNWELENKDLKILTMIGGPEYTSQNKESIGSAGVFTLRFKSIATGQEPLKLIYHRSWEKDVAPLQTFEVSVAVK
jgi:inhibitor of cysteine peptidase